MYNVILTATGFNVTLAAVGARGSSAYQHAVEGGYVGTEAQFNAYLTGLPASATAAANSATAASDSAATAATSATNAAASATSASTSATNAAASVTTVTTKASEASTSATDAATSAATATTKAFEASASASNAAVDAAAANTKAGQAATSATDAATSAIAASTSANTASTHATTAATKASEASTSATNAATSATTASTSATNAASSATAASGSATSASESASTATTQATNASSSAITAAIQAGIATTKASEAASSATTASTKAAEAVVSAASVSTSASAALTHANKAQQWADADLNVQVESGKYSAKHWAAQAQASVTGAVVYRGAYSAVSGLYPPSPVSGDWYKISDTGTLGGVVHVAGDSIVYDGTAWDKIGSTDVVTSVSGRVGDVVVTKADVDLSNVDNTSDADKPISTATQTALNGKSDTGHTHSAASDTVAGFMSAEDKIKLDSISAGATAYSHPTSHPASIIIQDADSRFVSDVEKAVWNGKQNVLVSGTNIKTINGQSILGAGNIEIQGGAGGGPTLQGDTAPYITQTKTYTITNYNSFSSYAVTASAGTASIAGDTITFTAPASAGNVRLTLTVDGQPTVFTVTVQPAGVATPTNTSPADGAAGVTDSPTLQSSAFVTFGLTDTHLASRWTLYQGGTQVHSSGWRTDALTSYTVPAGVMSVSTAYTWTVEHRGNALGDSPASTATSFTTADNFNSYIATPTATPANFGDALEGGFYAGMIWNQLVQSATSTTIGTGSKTFTVPSMTSAPIVYAGQQLEIRSRANPTNKMVGTVTGAAGTSLTIDVTSVGGSGTFSDWSVMARHRIIVAPKASGERAGIALKNTNSALPTACQTLTEGFAATQAMRDADTSTVYPAAHWARNLSINGFADWYIPARDESELCWRNLKPVTDNNEMTNRPTAASFNYAQNGSYGGTANTCGLNNNSAPVGAAYTASVPGQTAATAFRSGGAEAYEYGSARHWSSSEYNASEAWFQFWGPSNPGAQVNFSKTGTNRVRAVRRSVI